MNPTAPRAPKNKKKPTRSLVAVGSALLLVVVATVSFALLSAVSKEDYAKALTQYNAVAEVVESFDAQVGTVVSVVKYGSDDEYNAEIVKLDQLTTQLKDENKAFNGMKAVRFGEGRKFYGPFKHTMNDYLAYSKELVDTVKQGRPMFAACAKVSNAPTVDEQIDTMNKCVVALGDVGTLPEKNSAIWVEGLKEQYQAHVEVSTAITKLTDPFGAQYDQYKTLQAKKYTIEDQIKAINTTFASAMNARDDEVSVKATAEALKAFLSKQQ